MDAEQRTVIAFKGQITKLKKRAAAGICPCCNRQFANMAAHMKTKHPDFVQAEHLEPEKKAQVEHLNPHQCKVKGCKEPVKAKWMCAKHYQQDYHKRKNG